VSLPEFLGFLSIVYSREFTGFSKMQMMTAFLWLSRIIDQFCLDVGDLLTVALTPKSWRHNKNQEACGIRSM
jgi:hypothetical protein